VPVGSWFSFAIGSGYDGLMKKSHEEKSAYDAAAIAARDAEIHGKPPRIAPLSEKELSGDALDLITRLRSSINASAVTEIPEYFRTMVKHPAVFRCALEMGTVIFKGQVPPRDRELAVLRIGWLSRAPYEWGEHVDIGKRNGVTAEEVERVIQGSSAPGWSEHDAAILRAVEELMADHMVSDATWATLAKKFSESQLIEFVTMVGQYVTTGYVQNSLRMRLATDNPGLTYR
jgi:4-carboxymuconolactone decarboxylase